MLWTREYFTLPKGIVAVVDTTDLSDPNDPLAFNQSRTKAPLGQSWVYTAVYTNYHRLVVRSTILPGVTEVPESSPAAPASSTSH